MVTSEVTTTDRERLRDLPGTGFETALAVRPGLLRRVSWGSIIAGAAVAMTCQLVLTTLGAAIGLAAIEPAQGQDPGTGFAIGAGIWWLITGLVSLFVGGLVAGRLAGFPHPVEAFLHGLLVWSLAGILGLYLMTTTASTLVGGAFGPLAQGITRTSEQAAQGDPNAFDRAMEGLRRSAENAANEMQQPDPNIDPNNPQRQTQNAQLPQDPVQREVEARQAADKAADALSQASMWSFFALLLGALAAGFGGYLARPPGIVEGPVARSVAP